MTSTVGIEITQTSLRYLEVSRDENCFRIHTAKHYRLPKEKKKVSEVLSESLKEISREVSSVSVSLWDPGIIVRRISIPLMTPRELRSAVRFEAEKHIPFSIEHCVLDYLVLHKDHAGKKMDILLVACNRSLVMEVYQVFEHCNRAIKVIDIHPFALFNCYQSMMGQKVMKAALVHLGDDAGFIHITQDGQPAVVRDIGGAILRADGRVREENIEKVAESIKSSIVFYENSNDDYLDKLFVDGRAAAQEDLLKRLENVVERKFERLNVSEKLRFASGRIREDLSGRESEFLIPLGLAARSLNA